MGGATQAVPCPSGHIFIRAVKVPRQLSFNTMCSLLTHKGWRKEWRNWPALGVHHWGSHLIPLGEGNCRCLEGEGAQRRKRLWQAATSLSSCHLLAKMPQLQEPQATLRAPATAAACTLVAKIKNSHSPLVKSHPGHLLGLCFLLLWGETCRAACHAET